MIRAILLSADINVLRLAADCGTISGVTLTEMLEVEQPGVEEILSGSDAELAITCGLNTFRTSPWKPPLPSVSITFGPIDIVRLSVKSDGVICLVSPDNMVSGLRELPDRPNVRILGYDEEGEYEAAKNAKAAGATVLAGAERLEPFARSLGLEYVHASPGRESVEDAFRLAEQKAALIEGKKRIHAELDAIVSVCRSGIIKVDGRGRIIDISTRAKYLLDCRDKTVNGLYFLNVFDALEKDVLDSALLHGEHVYNHIAGAGANRMIVNIEPVTLESGDVEMAIIGIQKLVEQSHANADGGKSSRARFSDMKYTTDVFGKLIKSAQIASYTDVPILLRGEPGTEVSFVARCIHNQSSRRKNQFIEVECSIWDSGHMSEILFGPARQESAEAGSKCLLESADGGTIFFEHIDLLPQEVQYRIFRLIEGQCVLNSGITKTNSNIRVIASTQRNLRELMQKGEFREDLYYALSVATMEVPPLRERQDDVKYILDYFIMLYGNIYQKPVRLSEGAYNAIVTFNWPGNVRQLDYFCQRMILTTTHRNISEAYVRSELNTICAGNPNDPPPKHPAVSTESETIIDALCRNNGSKTKTAEELGMSRATLWRKMQKYGIIADFSV